MKTMKRILVLCLVAALCVGMILPASALADASGAGAYVDQLYRGLLGREPAAGDENSRLGYMNSLVNGGITAAALATQFINSVEFHNRALTSEQFVDAMYLGLLGRSRVGDEGQSHLDALAQGVSRSDVFRSFLDSTEFAQKCAEYHILAGSVGSSANAANANATQAVVNGDLATQYVYSLYTYLLGRSDPAADAGTQTWIRALVNRTDSCAGVASSIASSPECNAQNWDNATFLNNVYYALLGRQPDGDGWTHFQTQLANGVSRAQVFADICNSAEFRARYPIGEMNAVIGTASATSKPGSGVASGVNTDISKDYINRLYLNFLNRSATEGELNFWADQLARRELSAAGVAAGIAGSAEARNWDGTREDFVQTVYYGLFGTSRVADTDGMNTWVGALKSGYSRSWVFAKICASAEFQNSAEFRNMNVVPGYLNYANYDMGN